MTIEVTSTVTTAELRVGDRTGAGKVLEIDRKQVWALVHIADMPKPVRVKMDATWSVTRTEKTEEEKAAERTKFTEMILKNNRSQAFAALETAREKAIADINSEYGIDYSHTQDLLEAQALVKIWQRVDHIIKIRDEHHDEQLTLAEGVELAKKGIRESLEMFTAANVSTNAVSNVFKAVEHDVQVKFLTRWVY
jgi:hypothetical protein